MGLFFSTFLFIWIPCGICTALTAGDKGHNATNWFLIGIFLGPVALIAAAGLGDKKLRRYIRLMAENQGVPEAALNPKEQTPETSEPTDLYPKLKPNDGGSYPWMK